MFLFSGVVSPASGDITVLWGPHGGLTEPKTEHTLTPSRCIGLRTEDYKTAERP